jgi:hypothetical protein
VYAQTELAQLIDIKEETNCLKEIKDIMDELNSISNVFKQQIQVINVMIENEENAGTKTVSAKYKSVLESLKQRLSDINDLENRASLVSQDVSTKHCSDARFRFNIEQVCVLLDLKQKQATVSQAKSASQQAASALVEATKTRQQALFAAIQALSAQEQADATGAQNQILFIFTFITVVFLPLSFIIAYYSLGTVDASGKQIYPKRSYVNKVMFASSASITTFLIIGGSIWYAISKNSSEKRRVKELAEIEIGVHLPDGLLNVRPQLLDEVNRKVTELGRHPV